MSSKQILINELDTMPPNIIDELCRYALYLKQQISSESQKRIKKTSRKALAGCMKGLVWIADDFDAPLEDFKEYM
ncbi:MAG: DUF2281 domain-containing protein [Lachnospiraceae bacterium]|nr:DUF2281 domain-containing protein [Lachnospiraceae bacterium]